MGKGAWGLTSSASDSRACVEAGNGSGTIAVRDSTDRDGPVLPFPAPAWREFTASLAAGDPGTLAP